MIVTRVYNFVYIIIYNSHCNEISLHEIKYKLSYLDISQVPKSCYIEKNLILKSITHGPKIVKII